MPWPGVLLPLSTFLHMARSRVAFFYFDWLTRRTHCNISIGDIPITHHDSCNIWRSSGVLGTHGMAIYVFFVLA